MSQDVLGHHICRVCGDRASGFHYGVFCCEGCKGFFFRSVRANKRYRYCTKSERCLVLRTSRNSCKFCRMQRCIEVGMSYEAVKMGRCRKKDLSSRKMMLVNTPDTQDTLTLSVYTGYMKAYSQMNSSAISFHKEISGLLHTKDLYLYNVFIPDVIKFITIFARDLPAFKCLQMQVQKVLIKSAIIEVAVLLDAIKGNQQDEDCAIINHDNVETKVTSRDSVIGNILRNCAEIFRLVSKLQLTPVELSLLIGLALFSADRTELEDTQTHIAVVEESLLTALKCQLLMNHAKHIKVLPYIIEILCIIRGLSVLYLPDLLNSVLNT